MADVVDSALVLARLLHYAATTALFGVSLFPLYAYDGVEPQALRLWRRRLLLWVATAAVLSGLFWFAFSVAHMSGSLSDLADPEVVGTVLWDTSFGHVWKGRMLLGAVLIFLLAASPISTTSVRWGFVLALLAAALLASLGGVGHAQVEEGWRSILHFISDSAHLLAAGAWLGGLLPLACILHRTTASSMDGTVIAVLQRFSGMGYASVATLIATGFINSWLLVGSVSNLLKTTYGQVLLVKLMLFVAMLALAAANRFWLVPSLNNVSFDASNDKHALRRQLYGHVLSETGLGLLVLLAVSLLGMLQPAIGGTGTG